MEALLEREADVENWNDDRLDELNRRVDEGFKRAATKEEMNRRFDEVNTRFNRFEASVENQFGRINDRLDKLIFGTWATGGTFAATAFAALLKVAFF